MNVNSATDSTSKSNATDSTKNTASNTVDYNTFLQLLVAEMKNQDPTNPMDTSQYMSQFAQLSTVEQAMQTNSKLDALLSSPAICRRLYRRQIERRQLLELDDHLLDDIGLTREQAQDIGSRPFWK